MEYSRITDLARDIKKKINEYNECEPALKKEYYQKLKEYINNDILSSAKNRSLIYKGNEMAVVFCKTLGQWRLAIWKEITEGK